MFMVPYISVMYMFDWRSNWMCTYLYVFFIPLYFLALHVSGAICTHPQGHKLQLTAIGVCNGFGMLIHWSRYWLGHPHTFSTVRFGLSLNTISTTCTSSWTFNWTYILYIPVKFSVYLAILLRSLRHRVSNSRLLFLDRQLLSWLQVAPHRKHKISPLQRTVT
jgi:hypothetical protein